MNDFRNTSVFQLIQLLIKDEVIDEHKDFKLWLCSPWANTNKKLPELFEYIANFYPNYSHKNLNKSWLSKKIFQTEKHGQLNNHLTLLKKQLEKYFQIKEHQYDPILPQKMLARRMINQGASEKGCKILEDEIQKLEKKQAKSVQDYLELANLNKLLLDEPTGKYIQEPNSKPYQQFGHYLDAYYGFETAIRLLDQKHREQIFKSDLTKNSSKLKFIKELQSDLSIPPIGLYLRSLEFTPTDFNSLKQSFYGSYLELAPEDQQTILRSIINYAIELRFKGTEDMEKTIAELVRLGVEEEILLIKGRVTLGTYYNNIAFHNLISDFVYSEQFIDTFTLKLPDELQKEAFCWAKGHLIYHQGDYKACLERIRGQHFSNHALKRETKLLETMAYFDQYQNNHTFQSQLNSHLEAFQKWIQREKTLNDTRKKPYTQFINNVRKLIRFNAKSPQDDKKLETLMTKFEMEDGVILRPWLIQKIKQMGKGRP